MILLAAYVKFIWHVCKFSVTQCYFALLRNVFSSCSDVDNSVEYDPLDIRGHDEEEKYFDEDDTESTEPEPPCADVQMQD